MSIYIISFWPECTNSRPNLPEIVTTAISASSEGEAWRTFIDLEFDRTHPLQPAIHRFLSNFVRGLWKHGTFNDETRHIYNEIGDDCEDYIDDDLLLEHRDRFIFLFDSFNKTAPDMIRLTPLVVVNPPTLTKGAL